MMKKASKPNALLIELVIVLLFFSLSTAVILQLFVAAHDKSMKSGVGTEAMMISEDLAERFAVSSLEVHAFFEQEGWAPRDAGYEHGVKIGVRDLLYVVQGETKEGPAGSLDDFIMAVYDGDSTVLTIPLARYIPKEGTP